MPLFSSIPRKQRNHLANNHSLANRFLVFNQKEKCPNISERQIVTDMMKEHNIFSIYVTLMKVPDWFIFSNI